MDIPKLNSVISSKKSKVVVAHSPDADDAFMFYALQQKIVESQNFEFEHVLKDIQSLNKESLDLTYDLQAISFFAYPLVEDKYQLLSCGSSFGHGYGPILISKDDYSFEDLKRLSHEGIAVPGENTTAYLLLKLLIKDFKHITVPFDKITLGVKNGDYPFGLIIHEGQLSYVKQGLKKVVDLGEWWLGKTNLPLPLGGNVVKRSLKEEYKKELNLLLKKSIKYALENRQKVVNIVSKYAREIKSDHDLVDKFVGMYVNEFTLELGYIGKLAIQKLYQLAYREKLISKIPVLDFVEGY